MNRKKFYWIAIFLFFLPIFIRAGWYYRGFYFGNASAKTPLYEEVLIPQPSLSTPVMIETQTSEIEKFVVFDSAHLNKISINEIQSLINYLHAAGVKIVTFQAKQTLEPILRGAQAFISIAPTDPFKAEELQALESFTNRGGRLVVMTDPTRSYTDTLPDRDKSVTVANQLLTKYGISFRNDYVYNISRNEGNFRNVFLKPSGQNDLTDGINEVVFYGAHSIAGTGIDLFDGDINTLSSQNDQNGYAVTAMLNTTGNVLVVSDITFLTTPFDLVKDNARFINNIARFISKSRIKELKDFPALFSRKVGLVLTPGIELTKDMFNAISSLQESLSGQGFSLVILENAQEGYDLIIIGTYPPIDEVASYLQGLPITFNGFRNNVNNATAQTEKSNLDSDVLATPIPIATQNPESITVKNLGSFGQRGFSYFIYKSTDTQNVLILLAEKADYTAGLVKVLASGSLRGCLISNQVAVCKQDGVSINTPEATKSPDQNPTPTVQPTATPTPVV